MAGVAVLTGLALLLFGSTNNQLTDPIAQGSHAVFGRGGLPNSHLNADDVFRLGHADHG